LPVTLGTQVSEVESLFTLVLEATPRLVLAEARVETFTSRQNTAEAETRLRFPEKVATFSYRPVVLELRAVEAVLKAEM
jgi:hypothetical protein